MTGALDPNKKLPISAVIIACDEADRIEACLRSLSFCEEVILVDSGSRDATRDIARSFGAKIHSKDWLGYVEQRRFATSLATHRWVLSIDADERVTPELASELNEIVTQSNVDFAAYSIPRKTIHFGRWIRHGGWYPNRLVRFFDTTKGRWTGDALHERWDSDGRIGELQGSLLHLSFRNFADQVLRNNRYSGLGALELRGRDRHPSLLNLLIKPWVKFLELYVVKLGFLDGIPGLIIAVSASYSVFMKWAKLWEMVDHESRAKEGDQAAV